MPDAVAGPPEPDAKAATGAVQTNEIVRIAKVGREQVVIHILGRQPRTHAVETDGLRLEPHHRGSRVRGQRPLDAAAHRGAGGQSAGHERFAKQLLGEVPCHGRLNMYPRCPLLNPAAARRRNARKPAKPSSLTSNATDLARGSAPFWFAPD